jgi:hypothetical protein
MIKNGPRLRRIIVRLGPLGLAFDLENKHFGAVRARFGTNILQSQLEPLFPLLLNLFERHITHNFVHIKESVFDGHVPGVQLTRGFGC